MLVLLEFRDKRDKNFAMIFGRAKGHGGWRASLAAFAGSNRSKGITITSVKEAKVYPPESFWSCMATSWTKITGAPYPEFKQAKEKTIGGVFKVLGKSTRKETNGRTQR